MTHAVCTACGEIKFGALLRCRSCGQRPQAREDIAVSMALSDHHFRLDDLRQIGAAIARDHAIPTFAGESEAQFQNLVAAYRRQFPVSG